MSEELKDEVIDEEEVEEVEEELDDTDLEEDLDDDSEDDDVEKPDKKEYAIIKEKRKNKELKEKLAKLEQAEKERKQEQDKIKKQREYEEQGFSPEEAITKATTDTDMAQLRKEVRQLKYKSVAEKMADKYDGVDESFDTILELVDKGLTFEEACRAKLDPKDAYDVRTKTEAEAVQRRRKAESVKSPAQAGTKSKSSTPDGYKQHLADVKKFGGTQMTKKEFLELKRFKGE